MSQPITKYVDLPNHARLLSHYLRIHHMLTEDDWVITNIEMFYDRARTKLFADDIRFDQLEPSSQRRLLARLNKHDEECRALAREIRRERDAIAATAVSL